MGRESYELKQDILTIQEIINKITVANAYSYSDKLDHALMMEIRHKLEKHRDELISYRNKLTECPFRRLEKERHDDTV